MSYNNNTLPRLGKVIKSDEKVAAPNRVRPVSLYDNLHQHQELLSSSSNNKSDNNTPPSQALCLSTTVPVNIARSSIVGRHTPTRASVRHSRMLVLSQQTGRVPWKYLSPVVRWHRLASCLMFFLVLFGVAGLVMTLHLALLAPFLAIRDLPFWSASLNLMAGIACFTLACWCRKIYPGVLAPDWVCIASQPCIAICIGLLILASLSSICAFIFCIIRLIWIFQVECVAELLRGIPPHTAMLKSSSNDTVILDEEIMIPTNCSCNSTDGALYDGLACSTTRIHLMAVIAGLGIMHVLAACLVIIFLVIHWKSRRYGQPPVYSSVRHNSNTRLNSTAL